MKKRTIFISSFLISLLFVQTASASYQDSKDYFSERGLDFEAVYTGEYWANTKGGTKRDDTYLSNLNVTLSFDTEKLGLWENGTLFINVLDNSGSEKLTESIVGDLQTISNIEAPRTTRLFELWYEHLLMEEQLSVLFGVHDYNSEFNVTEYGSLFINSSFGVTAELAPNSRVAIFPLAAPALRLKYTGFENWEILFGIYDGDPGDPDTDEHIVRSTFDSNGGKFIAAEIGYFASEDKLPGFIKLGIWHSTGKFDDVIDTDSNGNALTRDNNVGGYLVVDKMLYQEEGEQGLGAFLQLGITDEHVNEIDYYIGAGLHYCGLFPNRDEDKLGLAVAHASISDDLVERGSREQHETVLELTYNAKINEHISIQPDFQFVINPGGTNDLNNAKVFGLRFEIAL